MLKKVFLLISYITLISAAQITSSEEAIRQMKAEFEASKQRDNANFKSYQDELNSAFKNYKHSLEKYWDNPKLSTKAKWLTYSNDKKTRSEVDFKHKNIHVETLAHSKAEAYKNLEKTLAFAIGANTKEVIQEDSLQKKVYQLSKKSETKNVKMDNKPILTPVLFDKKPTKAEIKAYTKFLLSKITIKEKPSKVKGETLYSVHIPLPNDTTLKRSKVFLNDVKEQSKRFKLSVPLVFAIMQTESDFNPFAKSHIPAYGLMQIVPKSAGIDSYNFIYHKKRRPSASYLYNSSNNIEMGSAYLHILYYRYLKAMKNPQSRLYCTIAAYNTGAGNIAWAFTKTHNVKEAAKKINQRNPQEVYAHLLKNLKYDEPKHYLKRVRKRMASFKKAYPSL